MHQGDLTHFSWLCAIFCLDRISDYSIRMNLGFAGICRETLRVIRSRPPGFHIVCGTVIALSLSLLAHVAVARSLFSDALAAATDAGDATFLRLLFLDVISASDARAGLVRLAINWGPFFLAEAGFLCIIVFHLLGSAVLCAFTVAPRYSSSSTDAERGSRAIQRDLRKVPRFFAKFLVSAFRDDSLLAARLVRTGPAVFVRFADTSLEAFFLLLGCTFIAAFPAAVLVMDLTGGTASYLLAAVDVMELLVVGAAYLAGAAYIDAQCRVACVLSMLEAPTGTPMRSMLEEETPCKRACCRRFRKFDPMKASGELLTGAGKFWTAAAVFATLDGCAVAVQLAFGALVLDNWMGLVVWLRVAAGVAMAAVLWAALMAGLVAPMVVYFVCKSCNRGREDADVDRRGRATRHQKRQ